MELGQRLRQARLEAKLSQRQLCDGIVTRNMLSQIENGSAQPSMATLQQFASRLGKSVGYFLEAEAVTSPNQDVMARARTAYTQGQYRQTLGILENYRHEDEVFDWERWLLEALAGMALARQVMNEHKNAYAVTLLEAVKEAGEKTPYYTQALERQRLLLLFQAKPDSASALAEQLPDNLEELLLRAQSLLDSQPRQTLEILDSAGAREEARWQLLRGRACQRLKDFETAVGHYHIVEKTAPEQVWQHLEECYRELGDFKQAYHYACRQRQST